jgi:hypothetical protein
LLRFAVVFLSTFSFVIIGYVCSKSGMKVRKKTEGKNEKGKELRKSEVVM